MSVNGTLVEDKMRRFKGECAHLIFNKCPIYIHDGASAKFSTKAHETDMQITSFRFIGVFLGVEIMRRDAAQFVNFILYYRSTSTNFSFPSNDDINYLYM